MVHTLLFQIKRQKWMCDCNGRKLKFKEQLKKDRRATTNAKQNFKQACAVIFYFNK